MSTTPTRRIDELWTQAPVLSRNHPTRPMATVVVWWKTTGVTPGKSPRIGEIAEILRRSPASGLIAARHFTPTTMNGDFRVADDPGSNALLPHFGVLRRARKKYNRQRHPKLGLRLCQSVARS